LVIHTKNDIILELLLEQVSNLLHHVVIQKQTHLKL